MFQSTAPFQDAGRGVWITCVTSADFSKLYVTHLVLSSRMPLSAEFFPPSLIQYQCSCLFQHVIAHAFDAIAICYMAVRKKNIVCYSYVSSRLNLTSMMSVYREREKKGCERWPVTLLPVRGQHARQCCYPHCGSVRRDIDAAPVVGGCQILRVKDQALNV